MMEDPTEEVLAPEATTTEPEAAPTPAQETEPNEEGEKEQDDTEATA